MDGSSPEPACVELGKPGPSVSFSQPQSRGSDQSSPVCHQGPHGSHAQNYSSAAWRRSAEHAQRVESKAQRARRVRKRGLVVVKRNSREMVPRAVSRRPVEWARRDDELLRRTASAEAKLHEPVPSGMGVRFLDAWASGLTAAAGASRCMGRCGSWRKVHPERMRRVYAAAAPASTAGHPWAHRVTPAAAFLGRKAVFRSFVRRLIAADGNRWLPPDP